MRRHFAALIAFLAIATSAFALTPGQRVILLNNCPSALQLNGGVCMPITLNLAQNIGRGVSGVIQAATSLLTVTRASPHTCSDLSGNWYSVGNNVGCRTNQGSLVEEGRTNSIRNNTMQGAVVGTPGTLPTNWNATANVGGGTIATSVIGTGTQFGVNYIDVNFAGTSSGTGGFQVYPEMSDVIAASTGQTWTHAVFLAVSGGTTTNVTGSLVGVNEINSSNAFLAGSNGAVTLTAVLTRSNFSRTLNQATTAFVSPYIGITWTGAVAINITLRVGWPQLELNPGSVGYASSPIVTTNAAVTRAADVVTLTNPPAFGSAYTLYASGVPLAPANYSANQFIFGLSDNTTNNRFILERVNGTAAAGLVITSGGTLQTGATVSGTWTQSVSAKMASSLVLNSNLAAFNGTAATAGNTTTLPVGLITVELGNNSAGASLWNGYIERIALDPTHAYPSGVLTTITSGSGSFIFEQDIPANDNFPTWFERKAA